MLGRFFASAASNTSSPSATRPSTAVSYECEITRSLLYPDTTSCNYGASGSGSGSILSCYGDLWTSDLDCDRDVRVLIAQDGSTSEGKTILFDSKPTSATITPIQPTYTNRSNLDGGSPLSPGLGGAFCKPKRRTPHSGSGPLNTPPAGMRAPTQSETAESELRALTEFMFGSVKLAYSGPSTKVHVLPSFHSGEKQRAQASMDSRTKNGSTANGKGRFQPSSASSSQGGSGSMGANNKPRKWVLITRMFAVNAPVTPIPIVVPSAGQAQPQSQPSATSTTTQSQTTSSRFEQRHGSMGAVSDSGNSFPFPSLSPSSATFNVPKAAKRPKTSMYAIGLLVALPNTHQPAPPSRPVRRCSTCWEIKADEHPHHSGENCTCKDPSNTGDDNSATNFASTPSSISSLFSDVGGVQDEGVADERMDLITKHWDVINRAMIDLQATVESQILEAWKIGALTQAGLCHHGGPLKFKKRIELRPGALMFDETVKKEVDRFRWRVVSGMRIPRVVTGQGRWNIWSDEARWANKRFGGREQNFFFLTLLTAFLGHHTGWLDVVAPKECRHNAIGNAGAHKTSQQENDNDYDNNLGGALHGIDSTYECALPIRTVIVAHEKTVVRRLIFLLSSFLPSRNHPAWPRPEVSQLGRLPPSRSSSVMILSQSPPTMSSLSKRSSVRSTNGSRKKMSKLSTVHGDDSKVVGWDIPQKKDAERENLTAPSSLQLPSALRAHRHSAASSATNTVRPIPSVRPSSSGSSASIQLAHALKRTGTNNTSGHSTDSMSMWGSLLSSIWSNPRSSSSTVATSEASHPEDPIDIPHTTPRVRRVLLDDDDECIVEDGDLYPDALDSLSSPPATTSSHPIKHHQTPFFRHTPPNYLLESPLNVELCDDGFTVNVDIPFLNTPSFIATDPVTSALCTSFYQPSTSPPTYSSSFHHHHHHHHHSSSFSSLPPQSYTSDNGTHLTLNALPASPDREPDETIDPVAGWIEEELFHPDYVLQGVKPYAQLEDDVKRAMRSEPTPPPSRGSSSKEVLVATTLLANADTGITTRFRLYRTPPSLSEDTVLEDEEVEERWEIDTVMDLDDILACAVESLAAERKTGCKEVEDVVLGALRRVVGEVCEKGVRGCGGNGLVEGVGGWLGRW